MTEAVAHRTVVPHLVALSCYGHQGIAYGLGLTGHGGALPLAVLRCVGVQALLDIGAVCSSIPSKVVKSTLAQR
jgi:hypothetical protein